MPPPNRTMLADLVTDEADQACGMCRNYTDGFCRLYLEPVEYADTCQRWH